MRGRVRARYLVALLLLATHFVTDAQAAGRKPDPIPNAATLEKLMQMRRSAPANIGPYPSAMVLAQLATVATPRREVASRMLLRTRGMSTHYKTIAVVGTIANADLVPLLAMCGYFQPQVFKVVSDGRYATVSSGAMSETRGGKWSDLTFEKQPAGWKFRFQQDWEVGVAAAASHR